MSETIQWITQTYPTLTEGERKIADILLAEPNRILSLTVTSLAAIAGVSIATVSRFTQHLGFNTYKELQLSLARQQGSRDDFMLNIASNDNCFLQTEKLAQAEADTIMLTLKGLQNQPLHDCAQLLCNAKNVLFFGLGTSFFVCEDAALKFKRLQKNAFAMQNTHEAAVTLPCLTENDVVIGISHSGRTKETCKILELAKKRNVPTIAVSTFPSAPIVEHADYTLFTMTKEIPQHRIAFTSRMSQLFLLDALFLSVVYQNKNLSLEQIEQALEQVSLTNV